MCMYINICLIYLKLYTLKYIYNKVSKKVIYIRKYTISMRKKEIYIYTEEILFPHEILCYLFLNFFFLFSFIKLWSSDSKPELDSDVPLEDEGLLLFVVFDCCCGGGWGLGCDFSGRFFGFCCCTWEGAAYSANLSCCLLEDNKRNFTQSVAKSSSDVFNISIL